jgi:hypothetical protein
MPNSDQWVRGRRASVSSSIRVSRALEVLLWCEFVNGLAVGYLAPEYDGAAASIAYRLVNWSYYIWPAALVAIVFFHAWPWALAAYRCNRGVVLLLPVGVAVVVAAALVPVNGTGDVLQDLARDVMPYGLGVVVLYGMVARDAGPRIIRAVSVQAGIAALFAAYLIVAHPIVSREEFLFRHHHALNLLTASALVVPVLDCLPLWRRVSAVMGLAAAIAVSVIGQFRTQVIAFALIVPVMTVLLMASQSARRRRLLGVVSLCAVMAVLLVPWAAQREELRTTWEGVLVRLIGTSDIGSVGLATVGADMARDYDRTRGGEAYDFVDSAHWGVWVVGAGGGATWYSRYWNMEWPIVHFGPLNLILRGGVFLAGGVLGLIAAALWAAYRNRASALAGAVIVYLLAWLAGFTAHGPLPMDYNTVLLWLVIGIALSERRVRGTHVRLYIR